MLPKGGGGIVILCSTRQFFPYRSPSAQHLADKPNRPNAGSVAHVRALEMSCLSLEKDTTCQAGGVGAGRSWVALPPLAPRSF